MKKNLLLTSMLIAIFSFAVNAQTLFDFESLTIPSTGYWNGSDESGSFGNNEISFLNDYNSMYQSWSGFSFAYDTITSDMQYAAYATSESGNIFGIGYVPSDWESGTYDNIPIVCKFTSPVDIESVDIANNKRTAEVIIAGDPNWGEPEFTDGDYFKIIIEGFYNGLSQGLVSFFLADYTAGNTFVADTWNTVNLSSLGIIDSLKFNLYSTHTGTYGMNTPAYFCIDNIAYDYPAYTDYISKNSITAYPNPVNDVINISNIENSKIIVFDISGKNLYVKSNCNKIEKINFSNFTPGIYFLTIKNRNYTITKKIIKQSIPS